MAGGRVGEAPTEFYTEASLPRAAIPAQNVDRKSLLALRPRLQAGECPGALGTYASVLEWAGRQADAARIRQESEAMTEETALEDSIRGF